MAELYLKQGQPARALAIYRRVVQHQPDHKEAARRLAELEAELTGTPGGAMSFREHMERIVNDTPGAVAGVVMGFDGIPVDTFEKTPSVVDITTILTEYSAAAQQARNASEMLPEAGTVAEVSFSTDVLTAVLRPLTKEYFLAVLMSPGGLTGKARYLMRLAAPELVKELA